jgi:hypothetical protein
MQAIKKTLPYALEHRIVVQSQRGFGYNYREIKALELKFIRKINQLKMYTEDRNFNYEQPSMTYDKKTGDVKIIEKSANTKTKIISNLDDLEREKALLMKEMYPER